MAQPVLAHRIVLSPEARIRSITPERALNAVIGSVQVPVKVK
jgi:MoxR-like ATPase